MPSTLLGIVSIPKQADPHALPPQCADHLTDLQAAGPFASILYTANQVHAFVFAPCVDSSSLYFSKVIFNCQTVLNL